MFKSNLKSQLTTLQSNKSLKPNINPTSNIKLNSVKYSKFNLNSHTKITKLSIKNFNVNPSIQKQKLFYTSKLYKKIICYLMKQGKKSIAEKFFKKTLYYIQFILKINPIFVLKKGLLNSLPFYEVRDFKRRGKTIPLTLLIVKKQRRLFLLFKSIKKHLKKQKNSKSIAFADLIISSYLKTNKYNEFLQEKNLTLKQYPKLRFRW